MLSQCRVLDLTNDNGLLCGKILADLGADVIKIEKPGGDDARRKGPFYGDDPDPEKSLYWFAYNTNKRGITLDIEKAEGLDILRKLIVTADFVIETFPPGYMEKLGLGYNSIREMNDALVMVSITPFGQTGPYRDLKASDIIIMGMSGNLYLTGDADRAPLNISMPQSYVLAGADGAVGAMMAYYHRKKTGKGQHVDISMQQSAAWFLAPTIPYWELRGSKLKRAGVFRSMNASDSMQRQVWPCKDGYVFFFILGGLSGAKTSRQLVQWMKEKGMADEFLLNMDWDHFDMGTATQDMLDRISRPVSAFFKTLTKKEILEAASSRNIMVCSLASMEDLIKDRNLKERSFWVEIDHPELGAKLPYPRQFAAMSETPIPIHSRAPLPGEHNSELYKEIGLTAEELNGLKQTGVI